MAEKITEEIALEQIDEILRMGATTIDLSGLELTKLPSQLWQLTNLASLNLSNNQLTSLPAEIGYLTSLASLNLSNNQLTSLPAEIGYLTSLASLNLSNNQLTTLPTEIGVLANLSLLNLSNNQFTVLPSEIGQLTKIRILNLYHNQLKGLPTNISNLLNLENLDISFNELESLPKSISTLKSLINLELINNRIYFLPAEISQLTNLESFSISRNKITKFPPEIGELTQITKLDVANNQLASLPAEIRNLSKLQELNLANNKLISLPIEIGKLVSIKVLDLQSNGLQSLPNEFSYLNNLENLNISNNHLEELPKDFGSLTNLRFLSARDNRLMKLPPKLEHLNNLAAIDLKNNHLLVLPESIKKLNQLKQLDLSGNSLLGIPPEILENWPSPSQIIAAYSSQRRPIYEVKILLVGQGSVGKTSLLCRLLFNMFDQKQTKTEGISINEWIIDESNKQRSGRQRKKYEQRPMSKDSASMSLIDGSLCMKLNIWDFGGQEIMHATHQFFLTKRSLYILVLDSRLTQEENRVEYWLKIIQSFGGDSPVLIVGNKSDQHPLDIDRTGLQKKFPNIVGILETSAATGAGIEELKAAINMQVNNLPHIRDLLPETWFTVKNRLEGLGKEQNFITHDKYIELCAENEVSDESSQRTLIGFMHDLGVVLHFQDDPRLEALGILNPQWVTNGVYKILNSHVLFQNRGVLTLAMLNEILNINGYPRDKRLFIIDMMKKFELCYDLEPDKKFLVPDLLPKDEPTDFKFNGIPAFEYAYPVLPSSVITRFIVRMNQKIDAGTVWRTGVLLKIGENRALVKADLEDRKITIAIDGLEHTRRDALAAIRYQLDEIHASIKGLNPQKRVPVPNALNAEPLDYDYLLQLERDGFDELPIKDGGRLVKINVRQMLSGVESEAERRKDEGTIINNYYNASDGGIIVGRDFSGNLVSGNYNKINSADIAPELKDTLLQLGEAVNAMIEKIPAEQAAEVTEDFGRLADEAIKPKPNRRWYSVSIEGLIQAAENLDRLGEPVINLSKKVLSLLTGGLVE